MTTLILICVICLSGVLIIIGQMKPQQKYELLFVIQSWCFPGEILRLCFKENDVYFHSWRSDMGQCVSNCLPLFLFCAELKMEMRHVIVVHTVVMTTCGLWLRRTISLRLKDGISTFHFFFSFFELWKKSAICFSDYQLTHNKLPTSSVRYSS